jgi:hypothetical protein
MIYTGNFQYLNIITILYILVLSFLSVVIPFLGISLLTEPDNKEAKKISVAFRKMVKIKQGVRGIFNYSKSALSVVMLVMCGYEVIVVMYIILTGLTIWITTGMSGWLEKYDKHIQESK